MQRTTTPAEADATPVELAVSTVIFTLRTDDGFGADDPAPAIWLPLVRRIREPYDGHWALPGGPLGAAQSLADAAASTLEGTTSLRPRYLEQLYAFGDLDRSPAERVVSIVYWALVGSEEAKRTHLGQNVRWFPADALPPLAFDHREIVEYALWRLRNKLEYSHIAHAFLGDTFTLTELREVHEAVLQKQLDPANFRRQVEASGLVLATDELRTGGRHRPARLYRWTEPVARPATPAASRPASTRTSNSPTTPRATSQEPA
ncbi:NUDIX hydrolase [Plantibacter sp. VKM Ac-2880]|uniref:NUDIX hydrolase n=1 Tax=Plantibacter sp. VKM Ac-2880 TaxID=2783827 RepID=UPI001890913C|nr:NUDIX domain-containing protein [Plantibacter sp. VKM Ac-2880]MBF4568680.1 NUDIX hydrolase [Plantibacter sp. VKM Ac-2880]